METPETRYLHVRVPAGSAAQLGIPEQFATRITPTATDKRPDVVDVALILTQCANEQWGITAETGPGNLPEVNCTLVADLCGGHRFPTRLRRTATLGWQAGGYKDWDRGVCAIAAGAAAAGLPYGFTNRVINHPQSALRDECGRHPAHTVARLEEAAYAHVRDERTRQHHAAKQLLAHLSTAPMPGARPGSARAIAEAVARLAMHACRVIETNGECNVHVAASFRQIAAQANVAVTTVQRQMKLLEHAGVFRVVATGNDRMATVWACTLPTGQRIAPTETPEFDLGDDAAHHRAFGKTHMQAYRAIGPTEEVASSALAERLGIPLRNMQTQLWRMQNRGMVERTSFGWRRIPLDPAAVAVAHGTDGSRVKAQVAYRQARTKRSEATPETATKQPTV